MPVVTVQEMQALDQRTIEELGIPSLVLMERASLGVFQQMKNQLGRRLSAGVTVLAGTGNNGGDGLVVARLLHCEGVPVLVALVGPDGKRTPDNRHQLAINRKLGLAEILLEAPGDIPTALQTYPTVIDALFGVGLSRPLAGLYVEIIQALNALAKTVVAIDIPSGLDGDRGVPLGAAVRASLTVTCAFPKLGLLMDPALDFVGQLAIADIGIPPAFAQEIPRWVIEPGLIRPLWPGPRPPAANKGSFGKLGIVAGSRTMSGAAVFCAQAALHSGAGLVYLWVPESIHALVAAQVPDALVTPLPEEDGKVSLAAGAILAEALPHCSALVLGPGLGQSQSLQDLLRQLVAQAKQPLLLDADGLNNLAGASFPPQAVLTPHPGELGRLLGRTPAEIQSDRHASILEAVQRLQCHVVLKGAHTLVAAPDQRLWINPEANPGLARGGSGDVLAGLLGGLLAQGRPVAEAAVLAVHWHAIAGKLASKAQGETAMRIGDIVCRLAEAGWHIAAGIASTK